MSNYAIMRTKKSKGAASLQAAAAHLLRTAPTPNADPSRLVENRVLAGAGTVAGALHAWRSRLPAKRRKDAVTHVQVLLAASPEWWASADAAAQAEWTARSMGWLEATFGRQNIIVAVEHKDETSPHLQAIVTPITSDGRLAAKEWLGGAARLSALQDSYHASVVPLGLDRGQKGSRAKHRTVKSFYGALDAAAASPAPSPGAAKALALQARLQNDEIGALRRQLEALQRLLERLKALSRVSGELIDRVLTEARGEALRDRLQRRYSDQAQGPSVFDPRPQDAPASLASSDDTRSQTAPGRR